MSATEPLVLLLDRNNLLGWPPTLDDAGRPRVPTGGDHVAYVPLAEALLLEPDSDVHIAQYSVPEQPYRLNDGAPERLAGGVPMVLLIFDIDCPKSLRNEGLAPEEWRAMERLKLRRLFADQPDVGGWESSGGYRLVARLPEPHVIRSLDDARAWTEHYVLAGAALHARYGIRVDPNCREWQRLQRGPRSVRANDTREPGVLLGNPTPGAWALEGLDLEAGLTELHALAAQHRNWAAALRALDPTPQTDGIPRPPSLLAVDGTELPAEAAIQRALVPPIRAVRENGGRHNLYLALSGTLLDRGFPPEELARFAGELSIAAEVDEPRLVADRVKAARSTIARRAAGQHYQRVGALHQGWPEVLEALDRVFPAVRPPGEEAILRVLSREAYGPAELPPLDEGSDLEVANVTLHKLRAAGAQIVHDRDDFWNYDGGMWHAKAGRAIEMEIHMLDGAPYGQKGRYKVNQGRVAGAVKRAATLVAAPGFFDGAPSGVAFSNGFLRAGGTRVEPISPEHRTLEILPYAYEPRAPRRRWEALLREVFQPDADAEEKILLLQQFIGSCLVGVATKWQRCLILDGPQGDNGKSTILQITRQLFPPETQRSIPPQRWGHEYYLAQLAGARINLVAEMPKTDIDASEAFKAVISGDTVTGRVPKGTPFGFHPIAGHIFACNELPGTSDQSDAWWKRFLPLSFNRHFTETEQDKGLADRIIATEMPGVAAWAVEGARDALERGGLLVPPSVNTRKEEWRRSSDQVALFAADLLEPLQNGAPGEATFRLYATYAEWSRANGHKSVASPKFEARLRSLGWGFDPNGAWRARLRGNDMGSRLTSIPGGRR